MPKAPIVERYDLVAQFLHWTMAIILIYLIFSSSFESVPDATVEERIQLHAGLGLTVIALGVIRWVWRFVRPRPIEVHFETPWQRTIANTTHHMFYALFLLTPAIGFFWRRWSLIPCARSGWRRSIDGLKIAPWPLSSLTRRTASLPTSFLFCSYCTPLRRSIISSSGAKLLFCE